MSRAELVHVDVTDLAANRRDEEPTGTGVDNDREAVSLSVEPAHSLQPEESSQTAELDDAVAIEIPDQTQEQLEGSSGAPIPPPYSLNVPPPLTAPLGPGTSPDAQTHVGGNQHFDIATVLAMHRGINDKAFSQLAEGTEILHVQTLSHVHTAFPLSAPFRSGLLLSAFNVCSPHRFQRTRRHIPRSGWNAQFALMRWRRAR
eukprot:3524456-Rhodomonas_salina.3